jgi:hypothetical protein
MKKTLDEVTRWHGTAMTWQEKWKKRLNNSNP